MKRFFLVAAALIAVALVFVAVKHVMNKRTGNEAQGAETVRVTRRDVGSVVQASGVIKPMVGAEVRVGSIASGVVSRLFVKIGDKAKKGALLAELDARDLVARRDAAEAAVSLANANVDYTRADLHRKQELFTDDLIPRTNLELAEQAYQVAEQQYNQAQANLADAKTQLGYSKIVAPIEGIVESVSTQEGETVASSFATPTFVTLLDLTRLEVWAYVDETDIGRIHASQNAVFTVDTYGDSEFKGRVTAIYPQAQIRDNVVDYVTVVRFQPQPGRILRPEMTANVRIQVEQHKNVLAVPIRALRREGKRQFVLVRAGDKFERRWITTGIRDDSYLEAASGLQENDEVVVGGGGTQ